MRGADTQTTYHAMREADMAVKILLATVAYMLPTVPPGPMRSVIAAEKPVAEKTPPGRLIAVPVSIPLPLSPSFMNAATNMHTIGGLCSML